jgi:hypothetical protein
MLGVLVEPGEDVEDRLGLDAGQSASLLAVDHGDLEPDRE